MNNFLSAKGGYLMTIISEKELYNLAQTWSREDLIIYQAEKRGETRGEARTIYNSINTMLLEAYKIGDHFAQKGILNVAQKLSENSSISPQEFKQMQENAKQQVESERNKASQLYTKEELEKLDKDKPTHDDNR